MICLCTYDRYVAVTQALLYRDVMQKKRICILLASAWSIATVVTLLPTILGERVRKTKQFIPIFLGIVVFSMILAMLVLVGTYIRLFSIARGHIRFMRSQQAATTSVQENIHLKEIDKGHINRSPSVFGGISVKRVINEFRYVKLFALVGLTFTICWCPFLYINLVADVLGHPRLAPPVLQEISLHTIFMSSLINAIIYGYYQRDFRRVICNCFRRRISSKLCGGNSIKRIRSFQTTDKFVTIIDNQRATSV